MRYDLIIIGETELAHRQAVRAARENQLVAVVRTNPLIDSVFLFPLETWNWEFHPTWKSLKAQFEAAEARFSSAYVSDGIELYHGKPLSIEDDRLTLSTRRGESIELSADRFQFTDRAENVIPDSLRKEVPHIIPLAKVPRLKMLPESVLIEGSSLPAMRFAILCARLHRNVILCSAGWNAPDFGVELAELEEEAVQRNILRLDQQDLHSVCERSPGEFDIWLFDGDVYRTGLYVYGAERSRDGRGFRSQESGFSQCEAADNPRFIMASGN